MLGALERAPCGFLTFDGGGIVLSANATLLEMLGVAREVVVGRRFETLLTVSSRIFYQTHLLPMLKLQPTVEELFLTLRCGENGDVAVLANVARHEDGDRGIYDCVFMRLRERRKWEDEIVRAKRVAEEANRANSALLSMMSHDVRTPIGSISGYCDLLLMGIRGPLREEQRGDVERMKKASEFVLGLIDDILSFTRLRAGEVARFDMKTIDVESVLAQTETLMGMRFEQAGVGYERRECTPELKVVADPDRLQQILLNLLTNAVKFTPRGGKLTVSCATEGEWTRINVADTGRGIPPDHIEQIFEPFVQVPASAIAGGGTQKGFGLGLAISRSLARKMNGDLTVSSTLGEGSTFTVSLRAPDSQAPSA
ncbi:MAG TPA: HAMP domain-containing sensor histidine kinase [Gemmatimonadaceae bacterium]